MTEQKWHNCKDKLPRRNKWVLIYICDSFDVARLVECSHGQYEGDPKFLQWEVMDRKNSFFDFVDCEYWCEIPYPNFCKRQE